MSTHVSSQPSTRPQRSTTNRMVAGVAGGLAEYARVDPLLIRVVFAVLTVFGGLGLIIYGICWLLLPREDEEHSIGEAALHKGRSGGSVLTALALVVVVTIIGTFVWSGRVSDLALLCLVLAAAVFLYRRRDDNRPQNPPAAEPNPVHVGSHDAGAVSIATVDQEADKIATEAMTREDLGIVTAPPPEPAPKPRRSFITPIVLCILVILGGITIAAGNWLTIREYLAIGLGIVGVGVLISTLYGKAIGLILLGIPMTLALLLSSMLPLTSNGGYGDQTWRATNAGSIQKNYEFNAGNMLIDLSGVDFRGDDVNTRLKLGLGRAEVTVPRDVDVTVDGRTSIGELRIMGHVNNGPHVHAIRTDTGADGPGGGTLHLRADIGFGQLVVHRATA